MDARQTPTNHSQDPFAELLLTAPSADQTPRGSIIAMPVRALYDARLNEQALSVLLFLSYQGNFAPNGWFSIAHRQIGEWFAVGRTTIIDRIRLLESCGYIRRARRVVNGRNATNVYKVLFDGELDPAQGTRCWTLRNTKSGMSVPPTSQIYGASGADIVAGEIDTTKSGMSVPPTSQIYGVSGADIDAGETDISKSGMSAPPTYRISDVGGTDILKEGDSSSRDSGIKKRFEVEVKDEDEGAGQDLPVRVLVDLFAERCRNRFGETPPSVPDDAERLPRRHVPVDLAAAIIEIVLARLPHVPRSVMVLRRTWTAIIERWHAAVAADSQRAWQDIPGLLDDQTGAARAALGQLKVAWPRKQGLEGRPLWNAFLAASTMAGGPDAVLAAARAFLRHTDPRFVPAAEKWLRGTAFGPATSTETSGAAPAAGPPAWPAYRPVYPVAEGVAKPLAAAWQSACRASDDLLLAQATLLSDTTPDHFVLACSTRFVRDWLETRVFGALRPRLRRRMHHPVKITIRTETT